MLEMPEAVKNNEKEAAIWADLTASYEFRQCDREALRMLCHWYAVAERLIEQSTGKTGKKAPLMQDDKGRPMPNPANRELALARGEIQSLCAMLGIEAGAIENKESAKVTTLEVLRARRAERVAKAAG